MNELFFISNQILMFLKYQPTLELRLIIDADKQRKYTKSQQKLLNMTETKAKQDKKYTK